MARADWLARTWQTDEGLPDNNVTGVEQAADGFLWVATLGGLMHFDGANFEQFSTTHLPKVPSLNVRKVFPDRRGQLWLAMDRGALIRVGATPARVFDANAVLERMIAGFNGCSGTSARESPVHTSSDKTSTGFSGKKSCSIKLRQ